MEARCGVDAGIQGGRCPINVLPQWSAAHSEFGRVTRPTNEDALELALGACKLANRGARRSGANAAAPRPTQQGELACYGAICAQINLSSGSPFEGQSPGALRASIELACYGAICAQIYAAHAPAW